MGSLGFTELLVVLAIVVVLFGVNRLPRLGKGLGEGIRNFRESLRPSSRPDGDTDDDSSEADKQH